MLTTLSVTAPRIKLIENLKCNTDPQSKLNTLTLQSHNSDDPPFPKEKKKFTPSLQCQVSGVYNSILALTKLTKAKDFATSCNFAPFFFTGCKCNFCHKKYARWSKVAEHLHQTVGRHFYQALEAVLHSNTLKPLAQATGELLTCCELEKQW